MQRFPVNKRHYVNFIICNYQWKHFVRATLLSNECVRISFIRKIYMEEYLSYLMLNGKWYCILQYKVNEINLKRCYSLQNLGLCRSISNWNFNCNLCLQSLKFLNCFKCDIYTRHCFVLKQENIFRNNLLTFHRTVSRRICQSEKIYSKIYEWSF